MSLGYIDPATGKVEIEGTVTATTTANGVAVDDAHPMPVKTTQLPTTLGQTTMSASTSVAPASDWSIPVKLTTLANAVTSVAAQTSVVTSRGILSYQAVLTGSSGTYSCTVAIEGSNDNVNYVNIGTITLSGTTTQTDGFISNAAWGHTRSNVTAISGTGATVNVYMGN